MNNRQSFSLLTLIHYHVNIVIYSNVCHTFYAKLDDNIYVELVKFSPANLLYHNSLVVL